MNKKFLILFILIISFGVMGLASAAVTVGEWTANFNDQITITNGQMSEFEYDVQAIPNFQGIQGIYSVKLFRAGNNVPIRTYFNNEPVVYNCGCAHGFINVTPSDYQNLEGNYYVQIYATDVLGSFAYYLYLNVIPAQNPLTVSCSANPTSGQAPLTTTYSATATGGSGIYNSYYWNFNDGQTQSTSTNNIQHTYQNSGTYNGVITVTDNQGHTASANCPTITVTPQPVPITVSCNANPTNGTTPLDVAFTATAAGGNGIYTNYAWNFKDGTIQNTNNANINHIYTDLGVFVSTVTVTDSQGHQGTGTCPAVTVNEYIAPLTSTCYAEPTNGTVPLTTEFIGDVRGGKAPYTYKWIFGNGQTQTTTINDIFYTYQNAGTYYPKLTVDDSSGRTITSNCPTITAHAQVPPLTITCNAYPTNGIIPLNVAFTTIVTGGSGAYTNYAWNFKDGTTQNTNNGNTNHNYVTAGNYIPTVTVTDNQGRTKTANCPTITATIPPLNGVCYAQPTSGNTPLTVNFTVTATGGSGIYNAYGWDFLGNGQLNTQGNKTSYTYTVQRTYSPQVTIYDSNGQTKIINCPIITATTLPPITGTCYANPKNGTAPLTTQFQVTATGGSGVYTAYGWDFLGNNQTNTQGSTATYTYQNAGTYKPDVTVYDNQGNQGTITCPTINVQTPLPTLAASCDAYPTSGYKPLNVNFTGTATGGSGIYYYYWTYGDGQSQYTQNTSKTTHTYNNIGTFNPTLKVTDSQNHIVTVSCPTITVSQEPIINYTLTCDANPKTGYAPLNVNFDATITTSIITDAPSRIADAPARAWTYTWTFNDGQTLTNGPNVWHTYNAGTFHPTVKAVSGNITLNAQCPTINAEQQIIITGICDARPTSGYDPLDVNLSFISTGIARAYTFKWIFDDGTTLNNGPKVTHTYNAGTYNPKLIVSYQNVSKTFDCPEINVSEYIEPLTASCNAYPTTGDIPLNVNFTGTANGGTGNYQYRWIFNDGQTQTTTINKTTHTYTNNGTYHPTLKVTDDSGNTVTTACPTIIATTCEPITGTCIINPTSGYEPLDVNITINAQGGSGTFTTYKYLFGDGQTQTTSNYKTTHTYQNAGYYWPKAIVTDSDGNTGLIFCEQVKVLEEPINNTLVCIANPTNGTEPLDVEFNAIGLEESSDSSKTNTYEENSDCYSTTWTYTWTFDDGQTLTNGANVWHTYNAGTYNPTVQATDGCETLYAECPEITVNEVPPEPLTASCNAQPTSGNKPLNVNFTAAANGGSGNYQYKWMFDDGQNKTTTINKTSHTYYNQGAYYPTLKVTDGTGNFVTTVCPTITVTSCEPITGTCIINPTTGYEPLNVNITINAQGGSGTYTTYKYLFGDGQTQTTSNYKTTHTYQNAGYYWPKAIVTDNQGNTGIINCTKITVQEEPNQTLECIAYPTSGYEPLEVEFNAIGLEESSDSSKTNTYEENSDCYSTTWTYTWTFDDGQTEIDGSNIWHTYNAGTYNPTVQATDGCETLYAECPEITVDEEPTTLTATCDAEPTSGDKPLNVNLTGSATGGSGIYYYYWTYGDGQSQYTQNTSRTTHTYTNTGSFHPTLKVTDSQNHIVTTQCPTINVTSSNPTPITGTCIANPTNGYKPLTTNFTVHATGGSGTYTAYKWTFDDGILQSTTNNKTTHTYNNIGSYDPTVKVIDTHGNFGIINCPEINVYEQPTNETLECIANPTSGYEPLEVEFNANIPTDSMDANKARTKYTNADGTDCYATTWTYTWTFDDGQSLTNGANVWHTYNAGTFNPTVQATDGCETLYAECPEITVNEVPPEPLTATCDAQPTTGDKPLNVNFYGTANGGTGNYQYKWMFDDGQNKTTTINKTTHTYQNNGTYHPTLKVTDGAGNTVTTTCPTITVTSCEPITGTCIINPTTGYEPLDVNITINAQGGSGTFTSYKYIFGDGQSTTQSTNKITHTYQNTGYYWPKAIVTDEHGHTGTINCEKITVQEQQTTLTATCDAQPTSGNKPLNVNFYGSVSGGSGTYYYYWFFDDDTSKYGLNETTHTYTRNGTFNPTLKVTDSQNHIVTVQCPEITVEEEQTTPLVALCYADPTSGYKPLDVNFTGTATGGTGNYQYKWTFNDGQIQTTTINKILHTYFNQGIYNPTLKVTDNSGNSVTTPCPTINVYQEPIINHTLICDANPTNGNEPLNVNFNAQLTLTENGITINPNSINKYYDATTGIECYDNTMTWTYKWIFDDGQTLLDGSNVWHTYNKGTYYPLVQATKGCLTLTAECPTINVQENVNSDITGICHVNPNNGNAPLTTELTVEANGGSGIYTNYAWDFDDGTTHSTIINNVVYTYDNVGEYTPSVVVTDNNGNTGTINCPPINVYQEPIINYDLTCNAYPKSGIEPLEVEFNAQVTKTTNAAETDDTNLWTYTWTFSDGQTLTNGANVWHTYNAGTFNPTVHATKGDLILNANCPTINVDIEDYTLIADPNGPYKDYVNTQIMFDGSGSLGEIVRYVWDFGDGTTVENIVPYTYHTYNNKIGVFPIKLTVYDIYGHSAVGHTTATIIEPTNFKQDEDRVKDGLWIGKIIIVGEDGIQEVVRSDDEAYFNIELANDYDYDLDDARIIIEIPELGIKQKSTSFDLRTGQEKSQSITVPMENVPQGWYEVKIIVQDDNVKRIKYRELFVSDTYKKGCADCKAGVY